MKKTRFVYVAVNTETKEEYVGSSSVASLLELETNHRQWKAKGYKATHFRKYLEANNDLVEFELLDTIEDCSQALIEIIEEEWIFTLKTTLNIDRSPTDSSLKYGRYTQAELDAAIVEYNKLDRAWGI